MYCINNTESMTLEDLKRMINTVDQVFGSLATHETYLTTDYSESIFHDQDAIQPTTDCLICWNHRTHLHPAISGCHDRHVFFVQRDLFMSMANLALLNRHFR